MVVGDGPLFGELKYKVCQAGAEKQFVLAGWYESTNDVYRAADVLLLPSLWESFGLVVVEAFAAGLPVVASNVDGPSEIVSEDSGFLCEPTDADQYANALARLIENPKLCREMGQNGKYRTRRLYDARTNYQKIVKLYEELLGMEIPEHMTHASAA